MSHERAMRSLTVLVFLLLALSAAHAFGQGAGPVQPDLNAVEHRLSTQVESVMFMVKLAAGIFSGLAILLTLFGISSYRGLLKEIREKIEKRVSLLEERSAELSKNLQESRQILTEAQQSLGLHQDAAAAILLARAEDCLAKAEPDVPQAVAYLSRLASDPNASVDELTAAGLMARERLGSLPLAKRLLSIAVAKDSPSDRARAIHAHMCADDPDSAKHEKTLLQLLEKNPYNEAIIKSVGNFYTRRDDWPKLEEAMRRAAESAPWLSTPHRVRGQCFVQMRRSHEDITEQFEKAVPCARNSNDEQAFTWYAAYLFNNGNPRHGNVDLDRAESLLREAVTMDQGDGRTRLQLGELLYHRGKFDEAKHMLEIAIKFSSDVHGRRDALALLASLGETVGIPQEVVSQQPPNDDKSQSVSAKQI